MYAITNNKKPVIFSDVDGTLYKNFDLKEETIKDVLFAVNNGTDFNICTGNPVQERMLDLAQKLKVKYLLCSSGGEIYDVEKSQVIKSWNIDFSILKELIKVANKMNLQVIFWDDKSYFYLKEIPELTKEVLIHHFISQDKLNLIPKLWNGEEINPIKIELYSLDEPYSQTYPQKIYKQIKNLKDKIEIIPTHCNVEINYLGVNKGTAIKWLVENVYNKENVLLNEVMTIGDSNNDTPMLKLTNYSYAMANATKEPLSIARFFTSDVSQNGLGEAILDYLYRLKNIARKHMLHEFLEGE
ncbi:HAD-IIB family hydrolase [Mycoplasmopsis arginini]|uniref:HAD-IIB family hydrolase n=1 Tax=Mycoplasmopsis arginini TaxID=2094 RepID=A0AA43R1P3_MYCAR|nr:HAD-IIB family hydrolase [Mycoplasmopsis arginini]MCY2903010.1 HAD-IIB family hydrolase [Mycoplasmopsis arginini QMP CG1-2758]MDI3349230.1 HAD-IIB family hydrolase [Mycoplasmopsis arginini]MDI3349857.1 HAD-IIB family hydrolase [Mycoplasmopsis arginini]MDI3350427.1 HAD-IIB family hydrolase [Mycoplasmopsis arginini]MDI3350990.1 HAD-IIB family hydrolase [Mycoplasmopsis arginini]